MLLKIMIKLQSIFFFFLLNNSLLSSTLLKTCCYSYYYLQIMDTTDQPNSICHVQHIQMYQLPKTDMAVPLPFRLLAGEAVAHAGNSVDGLLVLTNYRLYIQLCDSQHHVPLGLIELLEHRELFYLHIGCKDARTYRYVISKNCVEHDRHNGLCAVSKLFQQVYSTIC